MNIQTKTIIIIAGLCLLIIGGVGFISQAFILDGFVRLEEKHLNQTLDQTLKTIDRETQFMLNTAHDWAVWDDSYLYIQGLYPDYPSVNLYDNVFEYLNLDIIIYTQLNGSIAYAKGFDSQTGEEKQIPSTFFDIHQRFINLDDEELSGVFLTDEGPFLIVVRPILMSSGEGPVMGTLLFARFIDEEWIGDISEQIGVPITISKFVVPDNTPVIIASEDDQQITGSRVLTDIDEEPALILSISLDRDIYNQGVLSFQSVMAFIIVLISISTLLLYILVNHLFISRIDTLSNEVEAIAEHPESGGVVQVLGDDELASLARSINRMLGSIDASQESLRESEAQFRMLASLAPVGIVISDRNWKTIYASKKFVEIVGYTMEEIPDIEAWWSLAYPDETERSRIRREWEDRIKTSGDPPFEITPIYCPVTRKDQQVLYLEIRMACTGDLNFIVFTDITGRKQAEDAFIMANKKLQILSGITRHDILNQIMVMLGYLELAAERGVDETQTQYLGKVIGAAEAIQHQIEFTRTYESLGVEEPMWLKLSEVISQIRKGALPIQYDCGGCQVLADPMLVSVFSNLMDNTIRHAEGASVVLVRCKEQNGDLLIYWEDDGTGVPDDQKKRIFERGVGKNTGLGLFLSREILAITGITIKETGVYGKGARFEMTVPKGGWRPAT